MSDPSTILAQLDEKIVEAETLLQQLGERQSPSTTVEDPELPSTIEVTVKAAKGYGWVAKQINTQMAAHPDWKPIQGKTLRQRMGGQMLYKKTYTFGVDELIGTGNLTGGVSGKALKRARAAGKDWRNGGREKFLAKKKAEEEAKARAAEQAKAEAEDDEHGGAEQQREMRRARAATATATATATAGA